MLVTDIHDGAASVYFQQFVTLVGEEHWCQPVEKWAAHTQHNTFLREHYQSANALTFGLSRCSELVCRYGTLPPALVKEHGLQFPVAFMAQVLSLHAGMPLPMRNGFLGRVRNALRNSDEMRGLRLEMAAATHFLRRGHRLAWPELAPDANGTNGKVFDLLVEDLGSAGLEIECKAVSHDKGRALKQEAVATFSAALRSELEAMSTNLRGGLSVVVTVPKQLPSTPVGQAALARHIRLAILSNQSKTIEDGVVVRIEQFDLARLGDAPTMTNGVPAREVIDALTRTRNRPVLAMGRPGIGALLLVVQSAKEDSLLDAIEATARGARHQLSGRRPGLVLLGFDGIEAAQLADIARQDQTSGQPRTILAQAADRVLAGAGREHMVAVGFLSNTQAQTTEMSGAISYGGSAYHFFNRNSPHWHADFAGMFGGRSPQPDNERRAA
ncbi:hypothetical protein BJN34_35885 (plasmid) [Cupriavidus necator]|uniref:Uncharacterized protein n=1 Tax=Cupriavidus necator TaxID=106590 RepID=A0A1U9V372_CUPNE|nr:hypothetical protein [Cupriavidus necator]AQV99259.1 hypothetical protein BJN34_35885 [Cupriavidus necator]